MTVISLPSHPERADALLRLHDWGIPAIEVLAVWSAGDSDLDGETILFLDQAQLPHTGIFDPGADSLEVRAGWCSCGAGCSCASPATAKAA